MVNDRYSLPLLDRIEVATPCPMRWEDLEGQDARVRHCGECDLDVYNLAAMTRDEAEAFLRERLGRGRVCAGIYRRADGTIMTRDCPAGLAALRRSARWAWGRTIAALVAVVGLVAAAAERSALPGLRWLQPISEACDQIRAEPFAPGPALFGDIAIHAPAATNGAGGVSAGECSDS
ncbi:MAG: hypothetical protein ACF8PN_00530 [Phycisphaerales bacterium]